MSMRVTVRGAGIVGLAVAEELLRRGHHVRVIDPAPAQGASFAAAGMLSPAAEVWHGEDDVLRLGLASLALWPDFARRLGVRLQDSGTLLVGADAGDLQQVDRQVDLLARHGVRVEAWDRRQVTAHEPSLARVGGGAWVPGEGSVDPRHVCAALLQRVPVEAEEAGDAWSADVTVLATGSALPEPHRHLVRGVRGEILRLRTDDPPTRTVRGWVAGEPVYLVPRPTGSDGRSEVVVGATTEEHDDAPVVTAGGVLRLLAAARVLWPALDRAELVEATARDRPGTLDGLPVIGPSGHPGEFLAGGHHRHGVLLAPLTARLVADALEADEADSVIDPTVDPRRFTSHESGESHALHLQR